MYQDRVLACHEENNGGVRASLRVLRCRGPTARAESGEGVETEIHAALTEFIVMNYLFGDVTRVPQDDDTLVEQGTIDSTGVLELIQFLETHFDIEVSEAETVPQNLGSISSLIRFVMSKQSVREPTR